MSVDPPYSYRGEDVPLELLPRMDLYERPFYTRSFYVRNTPTPVVRRGPTKSKPYNFSSTLSIEYVFRSIVKGLGP